MIQRPISDDDLCVCRCEKTEGKSASGMPEGGRRSHGRRSTKIHHRVDVRPTPRTPHRPSIHLPCPPPPPHVIVHRHSSHHHSLLRTATHSISLAQHDPRLCAADHTHYNTPTHIPYPRRSRLTAAPGPLHPSPPAHSEPAASAAHSAAATPHTALVMATPRA